MQARDAASRRRAATDFATNLVVLAGAGTGKTSLVVERVLCAVGSGRLPMERIAAITFTEKAAGELRERIASGLERLRALARGEATSDAHGRGEADRAWRWLVDEGGAEPKHVDRFALAALEQIDGGTVVTIHGFCAGLLREFPFEAGVDPGFAVDAGEQAARLFEHTWEEFLLAELGPAPRREPLWRALLPKVGPDELRTLAWSLADWGVPVELLDDPSRAVSAPEALAARARSLATAIDSVLVRQTGLSAVPFQFLRSGRRALVALAGGGLEAWCAAVAEDAAFAGRLGKDTAPSANTKLGGVSRESVDELCRTTFRLGRSLAQVDEATAALAVEAVAPFVRGFRESFLRAGFVSFDGLLALTRDLLRDHPDVRARWKSRFGMVLVDEFQDTDPVQYEIVLWLGEQPQDAGRDAFGARLEPGRLFIVGDTKQSIYRFRGADYVACSRAVERIEAEGGATLTLTENFRSPPELLAPVNRLFEDPAGCWAASEFQPSYVPIEAHRPPAGGAPRVELWTVSCGAGRDIGERRAVEGRAMVAEIARLRRNEPGFRCARVTVLLRSFTDLGHYLRPMREAGIPFVVDGGREFLVRPEVEQLLAAFRTLSRPSDPAALLAFLRSPAGGVSDLELARYAADGGRWSWETGRPDPAHFPGVARGFALVTALAEETKHRPADAVIRLLVERAHMLPLGAAAFEGAQRVANLQKLAAAAGELARDGRLGLDDVIDALVAGRLEDIKMDRPLADDRAEAVRFTSIHRMKGLENDLVFLPGLSSARQHVTGVRDPARLARLPEGREGLAVNVAGVLGTCGVLHELDERLHEEAEETRVLYVALTRARERLVLLARDDAHRGARANDLAAWGYRVGGGKEAPPLPEDGQLLCDGSVLHRRVEPRPRPHLHVVAALPEVSAALDRYRQALARAGEPSGAEFRSPSSAAPEEAIERSRRGAGRSRDLGQAVGQAMHRILESWPPPGSSATLSLSVASREAAGEHAVDPAAVERETAAVLERFRQSELARRLDEVEVLGRELPVLCVTEHGRWHGSIDLLYRDADGALVVADYKVDVDDDEERLRARYAPQLAVYAEAVERALSLPAPPRTELWLLRTGRRIRCQSP